MGPEVIIPCVAIIAVGVAVIMYTLLRTPKTPAGMGSTPSIDLGEMPEPTDDEAEKEETAPEAEA